MVSPAHPGPGFGAGGVFDLAGRFARGGRRAAESTAAICASSAATSAWLGTGPTLDARTMRTPPPSRRTAHRNRRALRSAGDTERKFTQRSSGRPIALFRP